MPSEHYGGKTTITNCSSRFTGRNKRPGEIAGVRHTILKILDKKDAALMFNYVFDPAQNANKGL